MFVVSRCFPRLFVEIHVRRKLPEELRGNGQGYEAQYQPYDAEYLRQAVKADPQGSADDSSYDRADEVFHHIDSASVAAFYEIV